MWRTSTILAEANQQGLYEASKTSSPLFGDLVLQATGHDQKGLRASKFDHKWEKSYLIREAHDSGYFLISQPDSDDLLSPIHAKWLKLYYLEYFRIKFHLKFSCGSAMLYIQVQRFFSSSQYVEPPRGILNFKP